MKIIKICIGSACHLKGSYHVVETFKRMVEEEKLQDKVEIVAAFCLKNCTEAVSVLRWDDVLLSVSIEEAEAIFRKEIIPYL